MCFDDFIFDLLTNVHDSKRIPDIVELNMMVQRCISCETGRMVDLQNNGLSFIIYQHIKSQQLKTHIGCIVLRLA